MQTAFYWLTWAGAIAQTVLMMRIGTFHDTMREAVWPSPTFSDDYAEQSDWRR